MLRARGHDVAREYGARISFKGEYLCSYRLDMVVDGKLIIEIKATDQLPSTALRQLNNYLKSTDLELGLLLHFGPEPKFYRRILQNENKKKKEPVVAVVDPPGSADISAQSPTLNPRSNTFDF